MTFEWTAAPIGVDEFPPLPRVGVQFLIQNQFDQFAWYGRGPHET